MGKQKYLLVQPDFPIPTKSYWHKDYLPVGLLKLATLIDKAGDDRKLVVGRVEPDFEPTHIYVTSLFTYWSAYVRDCVDHYQSLFPKAQIVVGGVYASLQPKHCKEFTGCNRVFKGVHKGAEKCRPAYDLVPECDFQILHASRGCVRHCRFCGTYVIEPEFSAKKSISHEIVKRKVVFYDNNLLANPNVETILKELASHRIEGRGLICESQSGFDGRLLLAQPHLAPLLKAAHFRNVRIAWDGGLGDEATIREQLGLLREAGFPLREMSVFMVYNWKLPPRVLWRKAQACFELGVQVADCRYRPLDLFHDGYDPRRKSQEPGEYFISKGWSDRDVRGFRRFVRENNICLRYNIERQDYRQELERFSRLHKESLKAEHGLQDAVRLTPEQRAMLNEAWLSQSNSHPDRE